MVHFPDDANIYQYVKDPEKQRILENQNGVCFRSGCDRRFNNKSECNDAYVHEGKVFCSDCVPEYQKKEETQNLIRISAETQKTIRGYAENINETAKETGKHTSQMKRWAIGSGFAMFLIAILTYIQGQPETNKNKMSKQEMFEFIEYKLETEQMYRFLPTP